ncbi:bifunctional diguanylate cyclase/phosphodiesterase [Winogradskya consettensis]|uniref:Bifunctional diguanylate cyclase/phosphodiesterase n=1 Tax=Winogradskya consettensis TaxID=113560 RepID=A0A919VM45_9ACTN|nr:bifunctional diguanylate cyclase/phosphodiesterase [Actinoplanes consettensis]
MVSIVALSLLTAAGQGYMAVHSDARLWVLGGLLLVLDVAGAGYGFLASRQSPFTRMPWRLMAAGRAASAVGAITIILSERVGGAAFWWSGTTGHLAMYVLLAGGVLYGAIRQYTGRDRVALLAELTTVVAAGVMLTWYITVVPLLGRQPPARDLAYILGSHVGDLLLLAAIASMLLRGAVTRYALPITVNAVGLAAYLASDLAWSLSGVVAASLLLTLAPMISVGKPAHAARLNPPAWAVYLPVSAIFLACGLLIAVVALEGEVLRWGGIVAGLIMMAAAMAVRQIIYMRVSGDLIVSDPLTGLANRVGLEHRTARAVRHRESMALLLIDLDGFKLINDAYGHAAGDTVLIHFAGELRDAVRAGDLAARIGGDEFAVLLPGVTDAGRARAVAERILAVAAAHPVAIGDDLVPVRASIGVAVATDGEALQEVTRRADVAMYHSKRAGSHGCVVHDPSLTDPRADDALLSDDLDHALDRGELHVLYQPIVTLADARPVAAEALLRWQHPTRGRIPPDRFIPIAERSGAIARIGLWVLAEAAAQPFPASVNISPRQLREPTVVHDILAVLHRTGRDPRDLILEITESAIVDGEAVIDALRSLRTHGIRIAIDDFGTGYSSLQYLTRLPVDILKIDRSFVAELNGTPGGAAVTEAIIHLAGALTLTTVAEGIETAAQAAELQSLGCDKGQGYLYAEPLPAADVARTFVGSAAEGRTGNVGGSA